MKVFKVWVDEWDYDTYDSFVCVANSEDEIRSHISLNQYVRLVIYGRIEWAKILHVPAQ